MSPDLASFHSMAKVVLAGGRMLRVVVVPDRRPPENPVAIKGPADTLPRRSRGRGSQLDRIDASIS
jgi:hypothetical protein